MSFSTVVSAATEGLAVEFVHVEADVSNGLPVFHMVGYLASEVKEAGERVRTAIKNSGFDSGKKDGDQSVPGNDAEERSIV